MSLLSENVKAQEAMTRFIDELIEGNPGDVLRKANNFCQGEILDQRIIDFQHR